MYRMIRRARREHRCHEEPKAVNIDGQDGQDEHGELTGAIVGCALDVIHEVATRDAALGDRYRAR